MTIRTISELLNAEVVCCHERLDTDVSDACGSDMMSDVLAHVKDQAVLLTGLVNTQVIRTAMMMDMHCVVFVRGKFPSPEIISLAENNSIVVMASKYRMYEACGLLYTHGLSSKENVNG